MKQSGNYESDLKYRDKNVCIMNQEHGECLQSGVDDYLIAEQSANRLYKAAFLI